MHIHMSAKILNNIVLHFLETLPPAWLFDRSYTTWARDKSLTSQLPMVFKIYAAYTNIYFKIFKRQHYLRGGRHLIKLITLVWKQFQQHTPFKITINNRLVCLDLADPRFLAVIQELKEMADTKI